MKLVVSGAALLLMTATACGNSGGANPAQSDDSPSSRPSTTVPAGLSVDDAQVLLQPQGTNTIMIGTLVNGSAPPVTVTGGSSPVATSVAITRSQVVNGVGTEVPVAGGVEVPGNGSYNLDGRGTHVALNQLTKALELGEQVPITLTTGNGTTVTVNATVVK